jgi:FkbM family methyltransferase
MSELRTKIKRWMLDILGRAPPPLKGRVTLALARRIARANVALIGLTTSNLGLRWNWRFRFSQGAEAAWVPLFASAKQYTGEYGAISLAVALLREHNWFVDVGAHLGYFSWQVAAAHPQCHIVAVEANPSLAAAVKQNALANNLNQVQVASCAIADKPGVLALHVLPGQSVYSTLMANNVEGEVIEQVKAVAFDALANEYGIDLHKCLLKVDIEGAEDLFIQGAAYALSLRPDLIIELLGDARQSGMVKKLCDQFGYHAYFIRGLQIEHVEQDDGRDSPAEYNWLFSASDPTRLTQRLRGTNLIVSR